MYAHIYKAYCDIFRDIASLARAAVSGDESALDMFNWKRGGKSNKMTTPFGSQESLCFFIGGSTGKFTLDLALIFRVFLSTGNYIQHEFVNLLVTALNFSF